MYSLFAAPQNSTLVWRPESRSRGSFNILSTCLVVLVSCVWTAVHLNVPKYEASNESAEGVKGLVKGLLRWFRQKKFLWRKCAWVLFGILAPELVAYAAWVQNRQAKKLYKDIRRDLGQNPPNERVPNDDVERQQVEAPNGQHAEPDNARQVEAPDVGQGPLDWEMAHAYYASMGGFTFGAEGRVDFPFSSRATLTPTGLRVLAKYASDLIPRVTASEIKDKSKADSVAKLLLCTQIVWFFLQCITRLAQGLSISLLELNTLAHATCALFVYIQWWSKPLNILEPSEIGKEDKDKEKAGQFWCLLHLVSSIPIAEEVQNTGRGFLSRESPLKFSYEMNPDGASPEWQDLQPRKTTWSLPSFAHCPLLPKFGAFGEYSDDPPPRPDRPNEQRGVRLGVGKQLHNITLRRNARTNPDPNAHKRPTIQQRPSVNYIDLSKAEVDCWKLASMALKVCQEDDNCASLKRLTRYPSIRPRAKNWPSERSEAFNESVGLYFQLIAFGLASAIFGGLHLVAWDAYFPSHMEMFLWKISALAICSLGPVLLAGNSLVLLSRYRDDTGSIFVWVLCTGAWLLALVCSVCYVALYSFARVYILVACFANLVHLPDSAFEVPSWSQYFPHIS